MVESSSRFESAGLPSHPVRVAQLLVVTVAYIALLPAAEIWPLLVRIAEVAMIAAAVVVCGTGRRQALIAVAVGLPAAVLVWVGPLGGLDLTRGTGFVLKSVLLIYVLVLMLTRIFRTRVVTLETVGLAICSYLMTAVVWSTAYVAVELIWPGSFSCFAQGVRPAGWEGELVYFSFITMATVGYGDITPVAPVARSLAMLQAVTGTMFLAVVIAGLLNRTTGRLGI